jgi:hypothetical protein
MTARSDTLQKGATLSGVSALFRFRILSCFGDSRQAAIILPNAPQVERGGLFSLVYFAPDICDTQAVDFMGLKNSRKTYPLRDKRLKPLWQRLRRFWVARDRQGLMVCNFRVLK